MNNKVLIITYYWPPAGGPGVQRWLKFVKYLPEFGYTPIVYIPKNPTYPIVDYNLQTEIPKEAEIISRKIIEPYALARIFSKGKTKKISSGIIPEQRKQSVLEKIMLWIRGNIFIPDARKYWVNTSVKYLADYIQKHQIEKIITTGPPHSLHLIGLHLKQKTGIKWIADFRDPWTSIGYHKDLKLSSYAEKKHKVLEKKVLEGADTIIVTSPSTKAEFSQITQQPIEVITNGYDVENVPQTTLSEKFTLAHIGSLLSERNPEILWDVLQQLIEEDKSFASYFSLQLYGVVSQSVWDSLTTYGLLPYTENRGYVSHSEALIAQRKSQVLVLVEINRPETRAIIPGKLFEYMAAERPILAIAPQGADIEQIIQQTNTGVCCSYTQREKIKQTVLQYFENYQNGNLKVHAMGLQQYSRKKLTEKLAKLLS